MSWQVRHQGSPRTIDNLTLPQVIEGLHEYNWEPTDEVRGPKDSTWVPIESHPQLAEVAADIEPIPVGGEEDESHIDMNALIDVCLVLLVFFIITTTYAALQKRMEAPPVTRDDTGLAVITDQEVVNQMILVEVGMEGGKPVVRVEDEVVPGETDQVLLAIKAWVSQKSNNEVLLKHSNEVPHGVVMMVQDAAKGAGISRVRLVVP